MINLLVEYFTPNDQMQFKEYKVDTDNKIIARDCILHRLGKYRHKVTCIIAVYGDNLTIEELERIHTKQHVGKEYKNEIIYYHFDQRPIDLKKEVDK